MFGTAEDQFGVGPFGISDWGRLTIYESVPVLHRSLDADNQFLLRRYFKGFEEECEILIQAIRSLPNQRQPFLARGGSGATVFTVVSTTPTINGTVIITNLDCNFKIGQTVVFTNALNTSPPIRGVHTVTGALAGVGNIFLIPLITVNPTLNEGTVKDYEPTCVPVLVTSAVQSVDPDYGNVVTFTLDYQTDLEFLGIGYQASIEAGGSNYTFTVARMRTRNEDDPAVPETENYIMCYGEALPSTTVLPFPYQLNFIRQSALQRLTGDFGLLYDPKDPEPYQRSLVRNVSQYVVNKASSKGYQIRGNVAGFDVAVQGLYALCGDSAPTDIPWFLYDGTYYTDLAPQFYCFDDIPADIEFTDPETSNPFFPLDNLMYVDAYGDTLSPAAAVARCITENYVGTSGVLPYVVSSTLASSSLLASAQIPYGWVVDVQFDTLDDYQSFNVTDLGFRFVSSTSTGATTTVNTTTDHGFVVGDAVFFADTTATTPSLVGEHTVVNVISPTQFTVNFTTTAGSAVGYVRPFASGNAYPQGAFSLEGPQPSTADNHYIEAQLGWDVGTLVATYLIGSPSTFPVDFDPIDPAASEYCIRYWPKPLESCCYCKSYKIRLVFTASAQLIAYLTDIYDGDMGKVAAAQADLADRLVTKIRREQLPIHAEIAEVVVV